MPYTEDNDSTPAQDRTIHGGGTSAAPEAPASAAPRDGDESPSAGADARQPSPSLSRFYQQVGLTHRVGDSTEPTEAQRAAARRARTTRTPNEVLPDGTEVYRARDGSLGADPHRGSLDVAVAAALGLTATHAEVEVRRGLIVVTLVQPPRREAGEIRAHVLRALLATATEGHFQQVRKTVQARDAEIRLARRVLALRCVGTRESGDKALRRKVGVQVVEVKSR